MLCPNCNSELLGEGSFPFYRCPNCEECFEMLLNRTLIPLSLDRVANLAKY